MEEALHLLLRADSVERNKKHQVGMESQGLVLDQTLTKLGHDFYDFFYTAFEAPAGIEDFTIVLTERPARGNSALVALKVNDTELLEMPLPTRSDQMEETAAAAVGLAFEFLLDTQNVSRQLDKGNQVPLEIY
jgi:curli production assembly/transport component CsgE